MKVTEGIMGMSVAIEVLDECDGSDIDEILDYFHQVDETFSTYKKTSEISKINRKELRIEDASPEVKKILRLCEETKSKTHGYFDIYVEGIIDPSGLVKGYAIAEAAKRFIKKGYKNFYIEIGGDVAIYGLKNGQKWKVGMRDPRDRRLTKGVLHLTNVGIATSGTYERGMHIYDPIRKKLANDVESLTVIGPDVYEADRFATAAYAMGKKGIDFLDTIDGLEGYMITRDGKEFLTENFRNFM